MGRVSRLRVEDLLSAVLRDELVGGRMSFWFRLEVLPQIGWEFIRMNVYTFIQLAEFSFTSSNCTQLGILDFMHSNACGGSRAIFIVIVVRTDREVRSGITHGVKVSNVL